MTLDSDELPLPYTHAPPCACAPLPLCHLLCAYGCMHFVKLGSYNSVQYPRIHKYNTKKNRKKKKRRQVYEKNKKKPVQVHVLWV